MPILYAGVINRYRTIVLQGKYKKFKANYSDYLVQHYHNFEPYGERHIDLDDKTVLHYMD